MSDKISFSKTCKSYCRPTIFAKKLKIMNMKTKQKNLITSCIIATLILAGSACTELDEQEIIPTTKENLYESGVLEKQLVISDDTIQTIIPDSIPSDSLISLQSTIVGVPIQYEKISDGRYYCEIHYKTVKFIYKTASSLLLPPDYMIDENDKGVIDITCTRSGLGTVTESKPHYRVIARNGAKCEVVASVDVCVSVLGFEHWESHGMRIKFDGSHTAQVDYSQSTLSCPPTYEDK